MPLKLGQMLRTLPHLLRDPFDVQRGVVFFDGVVETPPVRAWFASMVAGLSSEERAALEALTRTPIDLQAMRALPADTFGHQYALRFEEMGFDPEFHLKAWPECAGALERNWVYARFARLHDMHHVMLGVDVSPQAELALQVFLAANTRDPVAALFVAALPAFASLYGDAGRTFRGSARLGRVGLRIANLFHFPYERHFETPLSEVRRLAGVPTEGLAV